MPAVRPAGSTSFGRYGSRGARDDGFAMAFDPLTRSAAAIALVGAVGEDYGRIIRANHQLADLLGRPLEELVGTRLCEHMHPHDQAEAYEAFLRLMAGNQTLYEHTVRLVGATARVLQVHALASVIAMRTGPAIVLRLLGPETEG